MKLIPLDDFSADLDLQQFGAVVAHDETVERLLRRAESGRLQLVHIPIAVLGNSGSARSAAINSIVQSGGIAREAGVLVHHEYCGPKPDQVEPEYYGQAFVQKAQAGRILASLFKDIPDCKGVTAIRRLLADKTSGKEAIVTKLMQWSDELIVKATGGAGQETVTSTASTAAGLLAHLDRCATDTNSTLRPLVSTIRIHFHDPLFTQGVSLLDVPGPSPDDQVLTHAILVTEANRAQSDPILPLRVRHMQDLGYNRVVVVVVDSERAGDGMRHDTAANRSNPFCVDLSRRLKAPIYSIPDSETSMADLRAHLPTFLDESRLNVGQQRLQVTIPLLFDCVERLVTNRLHAAVGAEQREVQERSLRNLSEGREILREAQRAFQAIRAEREEYLAKIGMR
ncbi:hypothetical protein TI39_contig290g00028 [Zymoseptoria brevis]|uniref:Dynamin family protein n=1 Tax=Zymoseptoria brevis TaxID=1047168 RepID=A0A0F4GWS3_9PEZI|nr:hypothetical protein TI39_contig290g00028 [Zymoseptoria brevis]